MSQRLFFGLKPPVGQAEAMHLALQAQRDVRGAPHPPQDLHLTLVFLGLVDDAERVIACVAGIEAPAFELCLDRFAYWPGPRVLLLEPSRVAPELTALVRVLQERLAGCGFSPDHRSYRPHLTLARQARPIDACAPEGPFRWPVEEFALFASGGGGAGPRYRVLRSWPLAAHPAMT